MPTPQSDTDKGADQSLPKCEAHIGSDKAGQTKHQRPVCTPGICKSARGICAQRIDYVHDHEH